MAARAGQIHAVRFIAISIVSIQLKGGKNNITTGITSFGEHHRKFSTVSRVSIQLKGGKNDLGKGPTKGSNGHSTTQNFSSTTMHTSLRCILEPKLKIGSGYKLQSL
ncbi:hypothetical protein PVAP13_9NG498342 [Panicum virgatum]|uniref:Uncharacterized protein n=1 Tax=Panicum virgatum TaxID=38727 RepID=A0A8T0MUM4_PANVG|nr:hypothetical protein PVAP13_9NG498342 [Panicum virgatum]